MRLPIVLAVALTFAFAGPRLTGARSRPAGEPFAYEPPEGFVEAHDLPKSSEDTKAWASKESSETGQQRAAVNQSHSPRELPVEEEELAKLAKEMPKAFEDTGCTWTHRRHEMRVRPDGARVGLIEGDCNSDLDLGKIGGLKIRSRKLQLIFPDDAGTSIVTASYPTEEATKWEPIFEATISKAKGVATRVPSPAIWLYGVWGGAGAILGWLLAAIIKKKEPATPPKSNEEKKREKKDDADDGDS